LSITNPSLYAPATNGRTKATKIKIGSISNSSTGSGGSLKSSFPNMANCTFSYYARPFCCIKTRSKALSQKNFTVVNESFGCLNCGKSVPKSQSTCRNHCPHCLHSLHVDNLPGDRGANCGKTMRPIAYRGVTPEKMQILFECTACKKRHWNKCHFDEIDSPDSLESVLLLGTNPI